MSYPGISGPTLVGYSLSADTYEYMMRTLSLGILEGPIGDQKPIAPVMDIINALHVVLAGGEVKIEVVHRGNPDIQRELDDRAKGGMTQANEINKKSGYYVTIAT